MNRNDTLKVFVDDGVLYVAIGVEALKFVVENNPDLTSWDVSTNDWVPPRVLDADKFAADVVKSMKDGTNGTNSPAEQAIDEATALAVESASEWIKILGDGKQ